MESEITTLLAKFFSEIEWPAMLDAELECFVIPFEGSQSSWTCLAYPVEEESQFIFYSVCPLFADPEHQPAVAEYLMRANYGLVLGNFEMSYETGEIRYKTSIDVEGQGLTDTLASHVVHSNVQSMDRYLPGLMLVLADGASPEEAIAQIEGE